MEDTGLLESFLYVAIESAGSRTLCGDLYSAFNSREGAEFTLKEEHHRIQLDDDGTDIKHNVKPAIGGIAMDHGPSEFCPLEM